MKENFIDLVKSICSGDYSQAQLVQYINWAQKISLGYLKYQEVTGKRISGERLNTEIELGDLAIDCIAELFSRDENGSFPQLKKYYETKFAELENITDSDVLILTRRLIVRKTKQELSRIFRERDPEGAKIVRNIKVAIRSSEKLSFFQEMGREFVFYKNGFHYNPEENIQNKELLQYLRKTKPPITEEILHSQFLQIYNPGDSISNSIKKILELVYNNTESQNYLAIDKIVKLLRSLKFESYKEKLNSEGHVSTPIDNLENKEIEGYIEIVMDEISEKIQKQYVDSGKLSEEKSTTYTKALKDVLYDLIQKKDTSSYYRNLKHYLPELSQKEYRNNERSVFEYLAKVAKRNFRKQLKELL